MFILKSVHICLHRVAQLILTSEDEPRGCPAMALSAQNTGICFLPGLAVFPAEEQVHHPAVANFYHLFTCIGYCIQSVVGKCMCSNLGVTSYSS